MLQEDMAGRVQGQYSSVFFEGAKNLALTRVTLIRLARAPGYG